MNGAVEAIAIAAGTRHSLALRSDGTVVAVGDNLRGQLGVVTPICGFFPCSATPVQVPLTDVVAIAAGGDRSYAVRADGTVWAWGDDSGGSLGVRGADLCGIFGTDPCSRTPIQMNLTGIRSVSAGGAHTLAVRAGDGVVFAWGENATGQLGVGSTTFHSVRSRSTGRRNRRSGREPGCCLQRQLFVGARR